ncbi:helix-turn-helix domain-containing protein [Thermococcus sp.]|uniref:helix-turn-helix domain-containing protein n=1 Tax=Thermococcus sp. TaxID=35749 RepID=UPI0019B13A72|nr:helix-turn-helix domain-containing protein [Thermococcus sp.]MBC7094892.1 helix-turn-helix domain-containing protein [Thermococcus sp.]
MARKFITTKEFAEMYGVKIGTVQSWCRNKRLKAIKLGKEWRIPLSELEKLGIKIDTGK